MILPIKIRASNSPSRGRVFAAATASTIFLSAFCGLMVSCPQRLVGQSKPTQSATDDGMTSGGYLVHSSAEIGYRSTDIAGSHAMYDTLVNLQSGPRLLEQSLSMHALDHQGFLFDDLSLQSFGWGGDPNNALRLRADKNKWYKLQSSFRRDQYFSDFDLLANPLNPPAPPAIGGSTPSIPVLNSPAEFATTRRMSDVDITLLPQSRVSFRLGYSHNNMTGPVYTSVHEGTEGLLFQPWNTTMNSYRMGVDFRVAPRTVLSYDQFFDYYRGDTDTQLASFAPALLPGGSPVELGLSIDTANKEPCAVKAPAASLIDSTGTLTNTTCSAYFGYSRIQRIRTSAPTERVSFRSNYFQRVDLTASFAYSDAEMNTPLTESFNGLITRTNTLAFLGTGTAAASRISDTLDLGATVHLTPHLRLIEKIYFWAYRIPEKGNFNELDYSCAVPPCNLLSTPLTTPEVPGGTPTVTTSSFNQDWKRSQTELAWDISKRVGARIGYRWGDRAFDHFNDFLPGDEDHFVAIEKTALLGLWARPIHTLRLNLDYEHSNYNAVFVRISPRKEARYRFQASYSPRPWAILGGSINLQQDSNTDVLTDYKGHNQNYGVTASLAPRQRFSLDLAYNYNSVMQNALICFADTVPTGAVLPFVSGATNNNCAGGDMSNNLMANSFYTDHTNFGMTTIRFRFDKRTTVNAGGSITSVDGSVPQFNILQPQGSAQYRFFQPVAGLSVDLGHKLAWNSGWNYYQYNEGSFTGPTAPRYFHANSLTESLRYAF